MQHKVVKKLSIFNIIVILVAIAAPILYVQKANAAILSLQYTMVRFDRLAASTVTGATICVKPSVANLAQTEGKLIVTFPSDFVLNTTPANWTTNVTNTGWPVGAASVTVTGSVASAVDNSGKTATFAISDLASSSTIYCFNIHNVTTEPLTTGAAGNDRGGFVETQTGASAGIDTGSYATSILSTSDQIQVNATVPPTFTFTISGGAAGQDTFVGNLVTGSPTLTTGKTATVSTNAANGWTGWVKSQNAALSGTGGTIASPGNALDATPSDFGAITGYGFAVTAPTGGAVVAGEYDGVTAGRGGTLTTGFLSFASGPGATASDSVMMKEIARITSTQAAATDYTDTLTIIAAGNF